MYNINMTVRCRSRPLAEHDCATAAGHLSVQHACTFQFVILKPVPEPRTRDAAKALSITLRTWHMAYLSRSLTRPHAPHPSRNCPLRATRVNRLWSPARARAYLFNSTRPRAAPALLSPKITAICLRALTSSAHVSTCARGHLYVRARVYSNKSVANDKRRNGGLKCKYAVKHMKSNMTFMTWFLHTRVCVCVWMRGPQVQTCWQPFIIRHGSITTRCLW